MNCWHCRTELIWDSDVDLDSDFDEEPLTYLVSYLHCPNDKCMALYEVSLPLTKEETND